MKETNGMCVMFYDAGFDLAKYKLGLRYNEDWVSDAVKFRHRPERVRLCCIVDHPQAVETSWRGAFSVPPLTATFPEVKKGEFVSTRSTATIVVKTKAIVFGSTKLSEYFSPKGNPSYMIVDAHGVTRMTYKASKWIAEDL
jgi:hypothetical protein